jgi:two-component system response regulator AlgR
MTDTIILPLTVFIVDDETPARNRLKEKLADCAAQFPLQLVGEAGNGQEALDKLAQTPAEVVLMDIRMPQMDGIELAGHLNKLEHPPLIIFTTAYDSYAVKAFEQRAIDYLLKPIRLGRLFDALSRARDAVPIRTEVLQELTPEARSNLSAHERGRVLLIPIEQVLYLRAELQCAPPSANISSKNRLRHWKKSTRHVSCASIATASWQETLSLGLKKAVKKVRAAG